MKTYSIYEIPGVKIGCTDNLTRRQKELLSKGELIILETYTCIDKASEREQELQRSNGYPVDKHSYKFVVQVLNPKAISPEAQKKRVANTDYKAIAEKIDQKKIKKDCLIPVVSISPEGVRTYHTGINPAARELTKKTGIKFRSGNITNVCNPNRPDCKTYRSYSFKYA